MKLSDNTELSISEYHPMGVCLIHLLNNQYIIGKVYLNLSGGLLAVVDEPAHVRLDRDNSIAELKTRLGLEKKSPLYLNINGVASFAKANEEFEKRYRIYLDG